MDPAEDLDALFVYGTLLPGHLRWPMLRDHASEHLRASAAGQLYDTGHGWPAAVFAEGATTIPGALVRFPTAVLRALLPALDAMEGIGPVPDGRRDPYIRLRIDVAIGDEGTTPTSASAWAYHATSVGPTWRPIVAWADQVEA